MKRKIGVLAVLGISLLSCSDTSEDYSKAATDLCDCMKKNGCDLSDEGNVKMNIGVCLLDAKVDLRNSKMLNELDDKCPEIKDGFEEFVETM